MPLKYKIILFIVIASITAGGIYGTYTYIKDLQAEIVDLRNAKTSLETQISVQNDAVIALKQDADARLNAHKQELEIVRKEAALAAGRATVIYKAAPSVPDDLCKSALNLMNGAK